MQAGTYHWILSLVCVEEGLDGVVRTRYANAESTVEVKPGGTRQDVYRAVLAQTVADLKLNLGTTSTLAFICEPN
ncbi:hypothetical protein [Streptomyces sp. SID5910]|uniref:hypothetical protein n=1 Tax=Streptomyces sp. SID5910 TaxID=2690312 RepID=UPI00136DF993|nr:hypothetical protein [Streptomyces sp. SID5910]MYR46612.1 hypothetical protein [Streptomyces sp. SID5910]